MNDLAAELRGRPAPEAAPRPPRGDVVTTFHCTCGPGALLGEMHRSAGRTRVWKRTYRHTRAHTAALLHDAAQDDAEALLRGEGVGGEHEAVESLAVVRDFLAVPPAALAALVPPLTVPGWDQDVTGIGARFTVLRADRPGIVVAPDGFLTECRDCRAVRDLGSAVVDMEPRPAPPRRVAVEEGPGPDMRTTAYQWPADALPRRVLLYRRLCVVLTS